MLPKKHPSKAVMAVAAASAVLVGAVIAVDSTTAHKGHPAAAPRPAPQFTVPSLRDPLQQISLSAYQGRPVIVNFFASWCGPCRRETPLLAKFYRESGGKVAIIGVDAQDKTTSARRFVAAYQVGYPVGVETTSAIADAYDVSNIGIPITFFLDSRHRIVKRVIGDVSPQTLTAGVALMDGGSAARH
jgi:cytochrome c biogenesis protein CcmG/thiol:disulfide interchange protein DsbE